MVFKINKDEDFKTQGFTDSGGDKHPRRLVEGMMFHGTTSIGGTNSGTVFAEQGWKWLSGSAQFRRFRREWFATQILEGSDGTSMGQLAVALPGPRAIVDGIQVKQGWDRLHCLAHVWQHCDGAIPQDRLVEGESAYGTRLASPH
jgi:hypothetical protein